MQQRKWLYHKTPLWINNSEERFFITVCVDRKTGFLLTNEKIAKPLLETIDFGENRRDFYAYLFLIMPDHVHGLFSFGNANKPFEKIIANWKRQTTRMFGIPWQKGFFDHRLRNDSSFSEKASYIRENPVRKGLCAQHEEWPWVIDKHNR